MRSRSPVGGALFGLFFMVMAALFIVVGARNAVEQAVRLRTYLPVPARIISSAVTCRHTSKGDRFAVRIQYSYTVAGTPYTSTALSPIDGSGTWSSSAAAAQELVDAYPAGAASTAYRAPRDPHQAFLIHHLRFVPYVFMLFPMIHFEIGLAVLLASIGAGASPQRAAGIMLVLALVWDAVGVAAFGHFLLVGGRLWWKPLIALALYGGLGLVLTVAAQRRRARLRHSLADAALDDRDNPYRRPDPA